MSTLGATSFQFGSVSLGNSLSFRSFGRLGSSLSVADSAAFAGESISSCGVAVFDRTSALSLLTLDILLETCRCGLLSSF